MAINLLAWYQKNHRQLPWREDLDPYKIWVSEIILQQTRVAQGIEYYLRFLEKFPDIKTLANSPMEAVYTIWQGLGYYRRAFLIHQGAKFTVEHYDGLLPKSLHELKKIPGIGTYTAAAIASIAFNEPVIALDGNLKRIAARVGCIKEVMGTSVFEKQAMNELKRFFPFNCPGDGNQALMDLSALICTPKNPQCRICPLNAICCAHATGTQMDYPLKATKIPKKDRYFWYLVHSKNGLIAFSRRNFNDIWGGLWEFPLIETSSANELDFLMAFKKKYPDMVLRVSKMVTIPKPHILSHQRIFTTLVHVNNPLLNIPDIEYFDKNNFPPSSTLVKKILAQIV